MYNMDSSLDESFLEDDENYVEFEIEQSDEVLENIEEIDDSDIDITDVEEETEYISREFENIDTDNLVDIDMELEDELLDANTKSSLIRDVLDQNVSNQRLLSDTKAEWSEPEKRGNSNCILKDDAEFTVKYKSSQDKVTFTGAEFKEHMMDEYGLDYVSYFHKEPDFSPFEQMFDKEKLEEFFSEKYGKQIEFDNLPEGHIEVEHMGTDRNDTYGAAYDYCIDILGNGITKSDLQEFMSENDLTWHECGDRETIQLIPSEINQVFVHTGGIGIEKDFESMQSEILDEMTDLNGDVHGLSLQKELVEGRTEGLDEAIKWKCDRYSQKKTRLFENK